MHSIELLAMQKSGACESRRDQSNNSRSLSFHPIGQFATPGPDSGAKRPTHNLAKLRQVCTSPAPHRSRSAVRKRQARGTAAAAVKAII
jgi:hypothetical protein